MMHLYVALKATTSHLPVLLTVSIKQQDMLPWIPVTQMMVIHYLGLFVVRITIKFYHVYSTHLNLHSVQQEK